MFTIIIVYYKKRPHFVPNVDHVMLFPRNLLSSTSRFAHELREDKRKFPLEDQVIVLAKQN